MIIIVMLGLAWSLFTLLVLPIITVEHITLWGALKKSKNIVLSLLFEIMSGVLWIMLIAGLAFIPFELLQMIPLPAPILLIISWSIVGVGLVISTVQAIFKTVVYWYYEKPIEEFEKLKYLGM